MKEAKDRVKVATKASIVGIFLNIILFISKVTIGFLANSISIISDAFNNLTDAGSVIVSLVGTHLANKPADKNHPFGHGRVEYISAFIVAFLVLQVGFFSLLNSIEKIRNKEELFANNVTIIILVISIIVKIILGFYYKKIAKDIDSDIFRASSTDSFSDVLITLSTLISIIVFLMFGKNIDAFLGVVVSLFIMYNAINIVRDTLKPLIGEMPDVHLYDKITYFVASYKGIYGTHDLIIHNYGPSSYMASIHAEVNSKDNIEEIHSIIDKIEKDAKEKMGIFLVIHMDPTDITNAKTIEYKNILCDVFNEITNNSMETLNSYSYPVKEEYKKYEGITFHDFRVVRGDVFTNIYFDIVVPWEFTDKDKKEFEDLIRYKVSQRTTSLQLFINFDLKYI